MIKFRIVELLVVYLFNCLFRLLGHIECVRYVFILFVAARGASLRGVTHVLVRVVPFQ